MASGEGRVQMMGAQTFSPLTSLRKVGSLDCTCVCARASPTQSPLPFQLSNKVTDFRKSYTAGKKVSQQLNISFHVLVYNSLSNVGTCDKRAAIAPFNVGP
jgi:hypothetical protein